MKYLLSLCSELHRLILAKCSCHSPVLILRTCCKSVKLSLECLCFSIHGHICIHIRPFFITRPVLESEPFWLVFREPAP